MRTRKYRIESNCAGAGGPDRSSPILLDIVVACGRTAKKYTNHDVDSSSRGRRSRPVPPPPKCCGCSMRRGFCCWHRSILFHSMYCITHPSARDAANATHAVELHYLSCHEMYSKKKGSEFIIILSFQFYYLYIDRRSIPDSNVL